VANVCPSRLTNLFNLICFMLGFTIITQESPGFAFRAVSYLLCAVHFTEIVVRCAAQIRRGEFARPFLGIRLPRALVNVWNSGRTLADAVIFVTIANDPWLRGSDDLGLENALHPDSEVYWFRMSGAIAGVLMWLLLLEFVKAIPTLSAFLHAIAKLMEDILKFIAVMVLIMIAFACAFHIVLAYDSEFSSVPAAVLTLYSLMLGLWRPDFAGGHNDPFVQLLFVVYVTLALILMMNLLIGLMATSYDFVYHRIDGFAKLDKAKVVVETEAAMSRKKLIAIFNNMHFDEPVEFDESDLGPAGGKQVLVPSNKEDKLVKDRIQRFHGATDPNAPWPNDKKQSWQDDDDIAIDDRLKRIEQALKGSRRGLHGDSSSAFDRGSVVSGASRGTFAKHALQLGGSKSPPKSQSKTLDHTESKRSNDLFDKGGKKISKGGSKEAEDPSRTTSVNQPTRLSTAGTGQLQTQVSRNSKRQVSLQSVLPKIPEAILALGGSNKRRVSVGDMAVTTASDMRSGDPTLSYLRLAPSSDATLSDIRLKGPVVPTTKPKPPRSGDDELPMVPEHEVSLPPDTGISEEHLGEHA